MKKKDAIFFILFNYPSILHPKSNNQTYIFLFRYLLSEKKIQIFIALLTFPSLSQLLPVKSGSIFRKNMMPILIWKLLKQFKHEMTFIVIINCVIFSFASYHRNSNISFSELGCCFINFLKKYNLYRTYLINLQCVSSLLLLVKHQDILLKPI